ncbi:X2-like carbohydrate binding domain-containing protein [Caproiciproducens faecalis]|uniref:Lysophospholipase L1-like esterase n=1 Tax=Caproiciproducens faecalis TaxID=2820301 RepID=A0ABS7DKY4_9FIRM|nr:X2-like carbohydrate binding domain-containing protein [Caproiciproducens faecalis]MBW7571957.1 hypothetical protein [Caproiciproducens faecalis]
MIKLVQKRACSLLLAVALVLTMLPTAAFAAEANTYYVDSNSNTQHIAATEIDNDTATLDSGWYVVDSGTVKIDHTLTVTGDVKLILADGASLTVNGSDGDNAGIEVTADNSLSIYAQSIGSNMGKLTATGSENGAGIGSDSFSPSGNISICGGRITATGGNGSDVAAGIGNVSGTSFGTISIYGGMVTATNGFGDTYPDIGGHSGDGDEILIKGGTIVSSRSDSSVNLGVALDYTGTFPEVVIDGGSIHRGLIVSSSCKNNAGDLISPSPDELTIPGQINAAVSSVSINGEPYGNGVYTDGSGKLYLNLPAYNSVLPVVVTMNDESKYWAAYEPGSGSSITLVNAAETSVFPGTAVFLSYLPQNIKVYKLDPANAFSGIHNGATDLTLNLDYTVDGDTVIIKKEYLETLPTGVASLSFAGLNATLKVTVLAAPEYVALGDSIPAGYGLPGYSPNSQKPPLIAYPTLVGDTMHLSAGSFAQSGMRSSELLAGLSDPLIGASLSQAKVITLSIGSDDILLPFLNIVASKLSCNPEDIQSTLAALKISDPVALAAALGSLNADHSSGLKNNPDIQSAASGFSANFLGIISALKAAAPNAKIYVTNVYNPYEGIKLPYGAGTLDLGGIADGYIRTLNSAFSTDSADYTLIDNYSLFSNSLKNGIPLVNADFKSSNLDPHPNTHGHAAIASTILTAGGYTPTTGTVSTAIGSLSENSTPGEVAGAIAQALCLPSSDQSLIPSQQIAKLEGLMQSTLGVTPPSLPEPVTTGFIGPDELPKSPIVATGLLIDILLFYNKVNTVTLSTIQQPTTLGPSGSQIVFDLTLTGQTASGAPQTIHTVLPFPVTVTLKLPTNFILRPSFTYVAVHTKADGTQETLPLTIGGTAGHYTATFTTSSFSTFSLVGTSNGSSSGSHHSSDGSVSSPSVTVSTAATAFVSDTNADFSVNGAYQFKITSQNGAAPSLTVGTPGVFETQLVRTSDNDYYFRLTAIGKPGSKAGIYINGVKLLAATVGTTVSLVKSDTTASFKVTKGKAYTFRLTANTKPSFTSGNSSVFQVRFVKQSVRDYFYQVTAVGKPGQAAGFYINSNKTPIAAASVA